MGAVEVAVVGGSHGVVEGYGAEGVPYRSPFVVVVGFGLDVGFEDGAEVLAGP